MNKAAARLSKFLRRFSLVTGITILVVIALLTAARLALPYEVKRYVNHKLQQLPGYGGSVGDVDIHLWRGAYTIHDVNVTKKTNQVPIPFLAAQRIDLSVEWRELKHRALVGAVQATGAHLNFAKGPTPDLDQTHIDQSWTKVVQDLFPFKINQFEIRESEVRYHDFSRKPKIDLFVTNFHVLCHNITNSRSLTNELPTPFEVSGLTLGGGKLNISGSINPFLESPRFKVDAKVEAMNLTALNDFFRAYAKVDVKSGTFRLYTEMAAADGKFKGYVKPLLENLKILDLKDAKHPLKFFWETLVAGVVKLFTNHSKDRFAAEIPIQGDIENPKAGILAALGSILRNAFVKALSPGIEQKVDLESVKKNPGEKPPPIRDTQKHEKSPQERTRQKQEELHNSPPS